MADLTRVIFFAMATLSLCAAKPMDREAINPLQLSTFKGYAYDYSLGSNGAYQFFYSVPSSHRHEERTADGSVRGSYSFVAPEGQEFDFKYQADEGGFKVQSDALPTPPSDTDEVRRAKEIFFEAYQKQLDLISDEEDSDESSEESSESDEDEESSEESDEESSEESDEDDDDDDDEEEYEGLAEEDLKVQEFLSRGKDISRIQTPAAQESLFFKPASPPLAKASPKASRTAFSKPVFNKSLTPRTFTSSRSLRNAYNRQLN